MASKEIQQFKEKLLDKQKFFEQLVSSKTDPLEKARAQGSLDAVKLLLSLNLPKEELASYVEGAKNTLDKSIGLIK